MGGTDADLKHTTARIYTCTATLSHPTINAFTLVNRLTR